MLHGAILYPGETDYSFITTVRTIRGVKWEVVIPAGEVKGFYGEAEEVIPSHCNLVVILDPDFTSFGSLSVLVRKGCHLFLTENLRMNSGERMKLIQLAEEGNTYIQIRNDLLFHPSLSHDNRRVSDSKLIEIHHVSPGKPGTLQEMMYTNLLMILRIVDAEPSRISVCSIPNSGYQPDVVNLHLNFNNGSAASLTFSFVGDKKEHLLSIHSASGVTKYDFKGNEQLPPAFRKRIKSTQTNNSNLLFNQIANFAECISRKSCRNFGLSEEAKTYRLIEKINQKLEFSSVLI